MAWRLLVGVLVAACLTSSAGAQDTSAAPPTSVAFEHGPWSVQQCLLGLTYGAPFKLAAAWGGGYKYEDPGGGADVCVFGAVKVGLGGARLSTGIGRTLGALGGGAAVSVGVLRTFGAPMNAAPKRTYVGGSLHLFPIFAISGEIGWYTRIGTDLAGAPTRAMLTWSAGFGF